jgi:hypothetical protein
VDLNLNRARLERASDAFHPKTGQHVPNNVLRRGSAGARLLKWETNKVFRTFTPPMTRMTYAELLTREAAFEAEYCVGNTPVKVEVIGQSTGGRDIKAYRAGDAIKPVLVFVMGVHGNEVDGTEGFFQLIEDLMDGTHPELKPITDQYSIWFIPTANPDGWFNNLRNLEAVGPNGQTVNLNRAFPFFWDLYNESGLESKGTAPAGTFFPIPELEADHLFNFIEALGDDLVGVFDHHQNIGQGHRYLSRNRVNSFSSAWANRDWDVFRVVGSLMKQRPEDVEPQFVQFRRSKNVPHFHSWASGTRDAMVMALESRKDEPRSIAPYNEGVVPNCEWIYDASIACMVTMTDAYWEEPELFLIEQEATNLVTNQEMDAWHSGNIYPEGWSRSRCTVEPSSQELFPHNSGRCIKATAELAVDPQEVTPDWSMLGLSEVVLAVGRLPSIPGDLQTMILSGETVATGPGASFTSPTGATRRFAMAWKSATVGRCFGGWSEDGNTLYATGFSVDATTGVPSAVLGHSLPITLADMGYATDGARYSVCVGGSTGLVSSPFVAALSNKILLYDATLDAWADTGLTLPQGRKFACVVHQPGTDKFWIFGGENADGSATYNTIHVYDVSAVSLTASSTTLETRTRMAGCGWGTDLIFLYGGCEGASIVPTETRDRGVWTFKPSTEELDEVFPLANIEDEASHDETPWHRELTLSVAARRAEGTKGDIFIIGGLTGPSEESYDQEAIYLHRVDGNTITFARDGIYALVSRFQDIAVTPGEWYSISMWARSVEEGGLAYIRPCLTYKDAGGGWTGHHNRGYYIVPFFDKWEEFRTAGKAKAGDVTMRPYQRLYVDQAQVLFERLMVCNRSRASSYHPTTRAAEKLTFSEQLNMDLLRLRFVWNPTFGFINVGEDLELARVEIDANNYISIVAIEGAPEKTYHAGNALVGPQFPQIECRKYQGGVLVATLSQTCYYGYDGRSSNQEAYDDPIEFIVEHVEGRRFGFGIKRFGITGWVDTREAGEVDAFNAKGQLVIEGEGWYGIPRTEPIRSSSSPRTSSSRVDLGKFSADQKDVIHPGEPDAA